MSIVCKAVGMSEFVSTPLLLWLQYAVFSVRKEDRLEKYLIIERKTTSATTLQYSSG
jgi:hypothetical protein